jgi:chromosomal replication initiation ATPase DnaA
MNTINLADQLVDKTCEYYGIKRIQLSRRHKEKPNKTIIIQTNDRSKHISTASIRMALSYYLSKYTPIPVSILGPLIGYTDHSTVTHSKKKAQEYIDTDDCVFMEYWLAVNNLGKELGISTEYVRVNKTREIIMEKINLVN